VTHTHTSASAAVYEAPADCRQVVQSRGSSIESQARACRRLLEERQHKKKREESRKRCRTNKGQNKKDKMPAYEDPGCFCKFCCPPCAVYSAKECAVSAPRLYLAPICSWCGLTCDPPLTLILSPSFSALTCVALCASVAGTPCCAGIPRRESPPAVRLQTSRSVVKRPGDGTVLTIW